MGCAECNKKEESNEKRLIKTVEKIISEQGQTYERILKSNSDMSANMVKVSKYSFLTSITTAFTSCFLCVLFALYLFFYGFEEEYIIEEEIDESSNTIEQHTDNGSTSSISNIIIGDNNNGN